MRIPMCSILLNDSDTERQIISYDPETKRLYSSCAEDPVDTPELETVEAAEDACYQLWFNTIGWDPEWIERTEE